MSNADAVLAQMGASEFNVDASPAPSEGSVPVFQSNHPDAPKEQKEDEANTTIDMDGVTFELNGEKLDFSDTPEGEPAGEPEGEAPAEADGEVGDALEQALVDAQEIAEGLTEDEKLIAAGVDMDAVIEEFRSTGKVSQETLDKAKEAGYSEKAIKSVMKGAAAAAAEVERQFFGKFGGQAEYKELMTWAAGNAEADAIEAFNDAIDRGDMRTAVALGKSMQRDRKASAVARRGTSNKQVLGSTGKAAAVSGGGANSAFSSLEEMAGAMNDKRYMTDPAYTKMVRQRAGAMEGSFFG